MGFFDDTPTTTPHDKISLAMSFAVNTPNTGVAPRSRMPGSASTPTRTAAGLPSVRWGCVSWADGSIEGEVTENAGRLVLHGCGLKAAIDGRIIAGSWKHGRLHGCGIVLNAADELTCSETWLQQPGGSLRTECTSETFPLRAALATPEARAIQSALAKVLLLAGSLRYSDEASGSCWAAEVEAETREVLRLVLSRYGAAAAALHMRCTCTAHALHIRCTDPRSLSLPTSL